MHIGRQRLGVGIGRLAVAAARGLACCLQLAAGLQLPRLVACGLQRLAQLGQLLQGALVLAVQAAGLQGLLQAVDGLVGGGDVRAQVGRILGLAAEQRRLGAHDVDLGECAPLRGLVQALRQQAVLLVEAALVGGRVVAGMADDEDGAQHDAGNTEP